MYPVLLFFFQIWTKWMVGNIPSSIKAPPRLTVFFRFVPTQYDPSQISLIQRHRAGVFTMLEFKLILFDISVLAHCERSNQDTMAADGLSVGVLFGRCLGQLTQSAERVEALQVEGPDYCWRLLLLGRDKDRHHHELVANACTNTHWPPSQWSLQS